MRGKQGGPDTGYPLFPSQTPRPEPSQALAHRIIWFSLPLCSNLGPGPGLTAPSHPTPPHPTPAHGPANQAACHSPMLTFAVASAGNATPHILSLQGPAEMPLPPGSLPGSRLLTTLFLHSELEQPPFPQNPPDSLSLVGGQSAFLPGLGLLRWCIVPRTARERFG